MNILEQCRDRIRYSAARQPLLLIPQDRLDEFLADAYEACKGKKRLDGVPWRCVPHTTGSPAVIDLAD